MPHSRSCSDGKGPRKGGGYGAHDADHRYCYIVPMRDDELPPPSTRNPNPVLTIPVPAASRSAPGMGSMKVAGCGKSMSPLAALPLDRTQCADRDVRHRVRASRRGTGHNMKEAP